MPYHIRGHRPSFSKQADQQSGGGNRLQQHKRPGGWGVRPDPPGLCAAPGAEGAADFPVDQLPQRTAGVLPLQRCPPDWPAGLKHRGHNIRACLGNAQPSGSVEGVFEEVGDSAADHGKVAWLYPAIRLASAN
jgi:hypothetical protein